MRTNSTLAGLMAVAVSAAAATLLSGPASAGPLTHSAVYTSTNAAAGNEVVVFDRAPDGTLTEAVRVATGGLGTSAGLGSQGAVTLTQDGRELLVVNAGSDDVSLFRVTGGGLDLVGRAPSGGDQPISVTVHGSLAYVVNAGGVPSVSGFRIGAAGITSVAGSTQPLNVAGPAQVQFTERGNALVVTGKASNSIDVVAIDAAGLPHAPVTSASAGVTPFGFDVDQRGHVLVSEAAGGAAGASSASSYDVTASGALSAISPAVANGQAAACWLVAGHNGRYAYVANTGSGTVSTYAVGADGSLRLVDAAAATSGGAPSDEALSDNGRFLYVRNGTLRAITAYRTAADGSLTAVTGAPLPATSAGLAAS